MNPQLINAPLPLLCYSASPKAEHLALQCLVRFMFFCCDLVKSKDCIVAARIFAPEMISHNTTWV